MSKQDWRVGSFSIAAEGMGAREVEGLVTATLGLHQQAPEMWSITHLNSGMAIFHIDALFAEALEIANEIAAVSDWSFGGRSGWKSADPDLGKKVGRIKAAHPNAFTTGRHDNPDADAIAAQIATSRGSAAEDGKSPATQASAERSEPASL